MSVPDVISSVPEIIAISSTSHSLPVDPFLDLAKSLEEKLDLAYEIYLETTVMVNSLQEDAGQNKLFILKLRARVVEFMKIVFDVESDEEMVRLLDLRKNNGS